MVMNFKEVYRINCFSMILSFTMKEIFVNKKQTRINLKYKKQIKTL